MPALALAIAGCTAPGDAPDAAWDPGPWPPRQQLLAGAARVPCETARIDVGERDWRPLLAAGFFQDEVQGRGSQARSYAWAGTTAEVSLLLAAGGARELVLTGRAAAPSIVVEAELDGFDLGERELAEDWSAARWPLPAGLAGAGPHRLRLRSSPLRRFEGDPRPLALAVDRIEIVPAAACAGSRPAARALAAGSVVELAAGEAVVAPVSLPPEGRLQVTITGAGGAGLDVYLLERGGAERLAEAATPVPGEPLEVALPGCCTPAAALVVVASEGRPVLLSGLDVTGDRRPGSWRRACGLLPWELAGVTLLLAAAAAWLVHACRRSGSIGPEPPWRPWADAAVVAAFALVVRLAFLLVYPEPGRSSDGYEYLLRSARLASGQLSFLRDTGWHAWQTWIRPPGYYLMLAALDGAGGALAAIRVQAFACGIAAGATYLAGWRLFGRLAGWVAGLGFAFYVESIVTFSRVLSEPLYMAFTAPALASLAWASVRPGWRPAALSGALFGLGAMVRSAALWYVPLAALALLAVVGPRRGWRPALAMVGAMALVVAPWIARNSWLAGAPAGLDDLNVANLLQVRPDDRFVRHGDLDLDTPRGWNDYYHRLQRANRDGALSARAGEVVRVTLAGVAAEPGRTAATFGRNLASHFAGYRGGFFGDTHGELDLCRVRWVTDLLNLQHAALLLLAAAGLLLTLRDRRTWPLALWLVFTTVAINLLFHPEPKYRLPTVPVLMVWAGAAAATLAGRLPGRGRRDAVVD